MENRKNQETTSDKGNTSSKFLLPDTSEIPPERDLPKHEIDGLCSLSTTDGKFGGPKDHTEIPSIDAGNVERVPPHRVL